MKLHFVKLTGIVGLLLFFNNEINSQTFGFGCLGLFGGYGGGVYQSYNAQGLNEFIDDFNYSHIIDDRNELKKYNHSYGYRVGVNFFRASWKSGFMITAKGFFQGLSKTNEAVTVSLGDKINHSFDLDMKNWSFGIDVGYSITEIINWKIIEGTINLNDVSLTETTNKPGETTVTEYESESGNIGYSVVTGIIIDIIDNYLSIEGSAGYTFLQVDNLTDSNGNKFLIINEDLPNGRDKYGNFLQSGGFIAVIQLNVGFPL